MNLHLLSLIAVTALVVECPGQSGSSASVEIQTVRDTVVVNAKRGDTVVVYATRDTVVVYSKDSEYCKQTPRPKDCPPKGRTKVPVN